ncbi:hypothetical protein CXG81DRAFT_14961 [Caulochytrium protostelioides]|uniref:CBS domain-containing protein n=1 Tax=Caulochytrium protostelioides TaxID=1555241 RepID=A0A4P9X1U7_9FUNG|nr:hypothetical protein CXG81DRAFT_14961 [Caulochytrium protostelioides]|eukprot:RKO99135.1 hypothetical protein CXG81DRAFT_14961 [Caulochytrium protostelioides]
MADPPAADAALKYRGASVEDLQLAAVVTVTETSTLGEALDRMLSHDFSQLPVISKSRKIFGFVTLASINQALHHGYPVAAEEGGAAATGPAPLTDPVSRCMYRFKARKDAGYMTITPATPLADLEPFFEKHAAGFVTDDTGRFPLAVVTKYDLLRFLSRRGVR